MEKIKTEAAAIAKETQYEDLACEILKDVEFKNEKAIAQAILQLSSFLQGRELAEQNALQDKFDEGYLHRMDDEKREPLTNEDLDYITEKIDEFLRNFPEYRCLDVIGKYKEWMRDKIFKTEK